VKGYLFVFFLELMKVNNTSSKKSNYLNRSLLSFAFLFASLFGGCVEEKTKHNNIPYNPLSRIRVYTPLTYTVTPSRDLTQKSSAYVAEPNIISESSNKSKLEKIVQQVNINPAFNESVYNRKISQTGISLIKSLEGFSSKSYWDVSQWTIGYGHGVKEGEEFDSITESQAVDILKRDLSRYERIIQENVEVPLTQGQYDATVSFIYTLKPGRFESSTYLRKLNEHDYAGAAEEIKKWVKVKGKPSSGLIRRRQAEYNLFMGIKE
jgi:lysozyme